MQLIPVIATVRFRRLLLLASCRRSPTRKKTNRFESGTLHFISGPPESRGAQPRVRRFPSKERRKSFVACALGREKNFTRSPDRATREMDRLRSSGTAGLRAMVRFHRLHSLRSTLEALHANKLVRIQHDPLTWVVRRWNGIFPVKEKAKAFLWLRHSSAEISKGRSHRDRAARVMVRLHRLHHSCSTVEALHANKAGSTPAPSTCGRSAVGTALP